MSHVTIFLIPPSHVTRTPFPRRPVRLSHAAWSSGSRGGDLPAGQCHVAWRPAGRGPGSDEVCLFARRCPRGHIYPACPPAGSWSLNPLTRTTTDQQLTTAGRRHTRHGRISKVIQAEGMSPSTGDNEKYIRKYKNR